MVMCCTIRTRGVPVYLTSATCLLRHRMKLGTLAYSPCSDLQTRTLQGPIYPGEPVSSTSHAWNRSRNLTVYDTAPIVIARNCESSVRSMNSVACSTVNLKSALSHRYGIHWTWSLKVWRFFALATTSLIDPWNECQNACHLLFISSTYDIRTINRTHQAFELGEHGAKTLDVF